jgi:hypothetical protein
LRYSTDQVDNPCAGYLQYAYSFGRSQSGRFLRHFLYLGLNEDEQNRAVFDGTIPLVAGGGRGEFNQRFGQPSNSNKYSTKNLFPFHDQTQTDPETGQTDGLLARLIARNKVPKVFFINTSAEYWGGHAALIHTDAHGIRDLAPSTDVRTYHVAGTQHGSGNLQLTDTGTADDARGQQRPNMVDYRPLLRAALEQLDRWVTTGQVPANAGRGRPECGTARVRSGRATSQGLRLGDYGIAVGKAADLVVWDEVLPSDVIAKCALPLAGFKRGRRVCSRALPTLHRP